MAGRLYFRYLALAGFFQHDQQPVGPQFRAETQPGLGLLDRPYGTDDEFDPGREKTQWQRFVHYLDHLNEEGKGRTRYKLIYVVRHGEGFHNLKEAEVGRAEWDAKWALLDGDGTMTWSDAKLTKKGKAQALAIKASLEKDNWEEKMPVPERHYTSPLARCLETTRLAFSGPVVVKELLRERIGRHTCDRRSTRSWIESEYPEFEIEPGLTERDELWKSDYRETPAEHVARATELLDDVFGTEQEATVISFTAHSGMVRALYEATGHREVWVAAGAMVPLLVKAELLQGPSPSGGKEEL